MDKVNSASGATFGFGKPNAENDKQIKETKVTSENVTTPIAEQETEKADANEPYTDERSVTIALVKNYSLYRRANDKSLPKRRDYIGGSVNSSRILSANKEEIEAYFPNIVGLAPNHNDFITRVKQYLNNVRIQVDELGKTFNTSFYYHHKSDYYKVKAEEEKIEAAYARANRQDIIKLKEALHERITRLNILESSKCKYGYPVNVEEYIAYRHCLLYKDIAKDLALINSDPSIRFYFKDNQKEAEKLKKYRLEVNKAKTNYVACLADDDLFDAVYIQYCTISGLPVISSLAEDRMTREIKLDKFSSDDPIRFNKLCKDKNIKLIATIEKLIARGELHRSQYNQNITTEDGELIGANMNEAVIWFNNPNNTAAVNAFINRLKNN